MTDPVEVIARAIERSTCESDAEFEERWADIEVMRHNRMIEARAALAALEAGGYRVIRTVKKEEDR